MSRERAYHHGDLRAALITASFEQLAEAGLRRFSVAAVARRLGVSSAAPYRHFPDRDHLLSAVSAAAAHDLRSAILTAADEAGADPSARLAAVAGAYFRYVVRTGAGFHVIYAPELYAIPDTPRRDHTRALMDTLIDLAAATDVPTYQQAVSLVEAVIAVAHGYTSLYADGFFTRGARSVDTTATRATDAARALIHA
ncbi:TetR family transcriptional regulator [Actinoplanes sp. SE50]|uniref:TetR/AcrR family transcriptional regulator n=1 Tax=unclassified Actinoplanes TaxID=2626549 RepID=UPI00023EC0A2|nr:MULTISPECIES: TetR/AcrR family transcriptional regulator [unclassified Actinoplanes]AEV83526.1 transcriptional regulator, TetR family [Actinoplanes sp. SE50/110]ATO82330.1 TetR family transcriptional regulator [Actinoplanes sp. SE50]SLL99737.1 TetR family transcriptional regulator [Actinoplanes sp. SE50/110]